ncbi:NUDIX domain-containing protein [Paraburkholderia sp. BR14263]|uniref:NUDIX domain-containing protein n=1 Tax=unclassified Paraburkholderia TaxID=2615204 RepID=UPI0034CDA214
MKERATVVCWQRGKILLVAKEQRRWNLPGGKLEIGEEPSHAALRELGEETTLSGIELSYLFRFDGPRRRHHVFGVQIGTDRLARPSSEISQCCWIHPRVLPMVATGLATRAIVDLACLRERRITEARLATLNSTQDEIFP